MKCRKYSIVATIIIVLSLACAMPYDTAAVKIEIEDVETSTIDENSDIDITAYEIIQERKN